METNQCFICKVSKEVIEGGRKESLEESTESECFLTPAEKDSPVDAWKLSPTVTLGGIPF